LNVGEKHLNQNNKVLLWLDAGPYAYLHYAFAIFLAELGNYDFYGLVVTKKDYEFFTKQKRIRFQQLFYYPDCYINKKTKPDVDYLVHIEKKYGLDLWTLAYTDRSFYEFIKPERVFHKFSRDEILNILEASIRFFVEMLSAIKPSFIVMQTPGENVANLLLYKIANSLGIKTLMLNSSRLYNMMVLSDNELSPEIGRRFSELKKNSDKVEPSAYGKDFLQSMDPTLNLELPTFTYNETMSSKIKRYVGSIFSEREPLYQSRGKTKLKMLEWKRNISRITNERKEFLDNNSYLALPGNEKFIYFPLHVQPEVSTLVHAPFYTDQVAVIRNIAKSLPVEYLLYVKEHPAMKGKNWRPVSFYKEIIEMPNVRLIHPSVDSKNLIEKSDAVITITGTVGLEALFYRKPVLVFADVFYDCLSMVRKVSNFSELPSLIKKSLEDFKYDPQELSCLLKAIELEAIRVGYYQLQEDAKLVSSVRMRHDLMRTEMEFSKFIDKHKNDLRLIAEAYHSKSVAMKKLAFD